MEEAETTVMTVRPSFGKCHAAMLKLAKLAADIVLIEGGIGV